MEARREYARRRGFYLLISNGWRSTFDMEKSIHMSESAHIFLQDDYGRITSKVHQAIVEVAGLEGITERPLIRVKR